MDAVVIFENGTGIVAGYNVATVANPGAGLWDIVFAYKSRTADAKRFVVRSNLALGSVGSCDGNAVTAIGAETVTVRINTRGTDGLSANRSFSCSIHEM